MENCQDTPQCDFTEYSMKMNQQEASQFVLDLKFKSSIIEQTKTELNYNILCLVAEVGGHLSLLLGLCGFGILSSIINVIFSYAIFGLGCLPTFHYISK